MKKLFRSGLAFLLVLVLLAAPALAVPAECNVYYPQLTDLEKSIYNAFTSDTAIQAMNRGESFSLTFDGPFSDPQGMANAIADAETAAFCAFELDHIEIFWVSGSHAHISGNSSSLVMTVTPSLYWNWSSGGRSISDDAATVSSAVKSLAAEAKKQGGVYDQLLYVYQWLAANNTYNYSAAANETNDQIPWTPLSALTDVDKPVCQGYATAFKLVCDELNIPCLYVAGDAFSGSYWDGHAWNQVLINGKWYAVDVTYGDASDSSLDYRYFLSGGNTVMHNGATFNDTHHPDGNKVENVTFDYPALNPSAYDASVADPGVNQPVEPVTPAGPEYPTDGPVVVRQSIPEEGIAYVSTQTVMLGDKQITLPAYKLLNEEGNPTNYVRLRDLAALLDGTAAEFDVMWDPVLGICIQPLCPYLNPNGTEGQIPFTGDQPYKVYLRDTLINDGSVPLTAFQITWEGGGHTYYQLRDLGRALNFNVGWSGERGIYIEPGVPYTDAD